MTADTLIARLESATEGSRDLDWEIALVIARKVYPDARFVLDKQGQPMQWIQARPGLTLSDAPNYTTSLDDALGLVPEGWSWRVSVSERKQHPVVWLGRSHPTNATVAQEAATPALAVCAAILRAKEADHAR